MSEKIEDGSFVWSYVDTAAMLNPSSFIRVVCHVHRLSLGKQEQHDGLHTLHTICHFGNIKEGVEARAIQL